MREVRSTARCNASNLASAESNAARSKRRDAGLPESPSEYKPRRGLRVTGCASQSGELDLRSRCAWLGAYFAGWLAYQVAMLSISALL